MKYYVIAGEASGDLHASNLMRELLKLDSSVDFHFWGGDLMASVTNKKPYKHIRDLAFMGFVEVAKNIRTIFKNIAFCKQSILDVKPDVLILVDYPGFNLRIAEWAKQQGIKVLYYISPTIWAWKENRVNIVKRCVDKMYVILPFEVEVYKKHHVEVEYAGHPLLDAIEQEKQKMPSREDFLVNNKLDHRPIIAVLPGSRMQELEKMFAVMLEIVKDFPDYQFVIAGTTNLPAKAYEIATKQNVKIIFNQTYPLLNYAYAGVIKSGTSTLESALFKLPQVVCYKGGALSFKIAKLVVGDRIKFIALPNLIMNKAIVKELVQEDFNTQYLKQELKNILNSSNRETILKQYDELIHLLGGSGTSKKIAELMHQNIHAK
jgi:lipid-A-disaccharide synthase